MNSQQNKLSEFEQVPGDKILVLFDGYCNFCNGAVQFIIKRDKKEKFRFASLSWPVGEAVRKKFPAYASADSILVYHQGKLMARSSAALYISKHLGALWPTAGVFRVVPSVIRDAVYDWVARNRYRWFGKKDTCMMPEKDVSHLFIKE